VTVMTFYGGGELAADLAGLPSVRLVSLDKSDRWDVAGLLRRAWRVVRDVKPHVVHGYMGGPNELAWLLGRASGAKVVWGLRASNVDFSHYDWVSTLLFRGGAALSRFVDLTIANSDAGLRHHAERGYRSRRMIVIPNGIDTDAFRRDEAGRIRLRSDWGVARGNLVVGIVARLDPMKDQATFLEAASLASARRSDLRFAIVGAGPAAIERELRALADRLKLGDRVIWAGLQHNMPAIHSALDVATSASAFGEGFSNAVAEAMACEVPVVATDVGDSAALIGDAGVSVAPKDAAALCDGWLRLLALSPEARAHLGEQARRRIVSEFSVSRLVARTEAALLDLHARSSAAAAA
jgi:glycosyltransferase involved in cell wall biosynthesis